MAVVDIKAFIRVVSECVESSTEALDTSSKVLRSLKENNEGREGIGLLEVKNRELLAYMLEMANFMDRMGSGQSITESKGFLRAALHRTVIEKIKPIEQKLSSQIDKLMKLKEGKEAVSNPVPRVDDMEFDDEAGDQAAAEGDNQEDQVKRYVAPKVMAMHYDEEDDDGARRQNRAKKRALQSSLIQELKQQYSTAPEEYRDVSVQQTKRMKAIETYEEDYMTRLPVTRAQRNIEDRYKNRSTADELLNFGAYMVREESSTGYKGKRKGMKNESGDGRRKINTKISRAKDKKAKERGKQKKIMKRR